MKEIIIITYDWIVDKETCEHRVKIKIAVDEIQFKNELDEK